MENFKKLSREELKNTFGGKRGCTLTVRNANGTFTTMTGTCDSQFEPTVNSNSDGSASLGLALVSFCNTGDGVAHALSSNGGASRC